MPIDYSEYHPKWTLIVRLILKRANNKCEWCGVQNHEVIKRLRGDEYRVPTSGELSTVHLLVTDVKVTMAKALKKVGLTKIILTTAHVDHDKNNNRFWNLASLCQRCHLGHDREQHSRNRKYGRKHKGKQQLKMNL